MSTETSWEVPGGFTNTGLCINGDGNFAIGNWSQNRIQIANIYGEGIGYIALQDMPTNSLQGVAWDSLRGNYWVCKYSTSGEGEIRRYSTDGTMLASFPANRAGWVGPNGCAYEASSDRLLVAFGGDEFKAYSCSTGEQMESVKVIGSIGGQMDGIALDPDPGYVWLSVDAANKVFKVHRTTGAQISNFAIPSSPENIAFMGGILHICCDRLYHEGIPNGNRVHRYTLQGVPSLVPPRPAAARPEPIVLPRSPVTSAWVQDDPLIIPPTVATAGWPSIWGM